MARETGRFVFFIDQHRLTTKVAEIRTVDDLPGSVITPFVENLRTKYGSAIDVRLLENHNTGEFDCALVEFVGAFKP